MTGLQYISERNAGFSLVRMLFYIFVLASFMSLVYRVGGYPLYPSYVPLLALALVSTLLVAKNSKVRIPEYGDITVVVIGLLPFLLAFFARNPEQARENSLVFLYFSATFLVTKALLGRGALTIRDIVKGFSFVSVVIWTVALLQATTGSPIGIVARYLGSSNLEGALYQDSFRVSATMTSPNVFANSLVLLFPALIRNSLNRLNKAQAVVAVVVLVSVGLVLVVASGSRAGLLYFFISMLGAYFVWLRKDHAIKNRWTTIYLLLFLLAPVGYSFYAADLGNSAVFARFFETGDSGRLSTYYAALFVMQHPGSLLAGVGAGQFFDELYYRNIQTEYLPWMDPRDIPSTVHNWILQIGSEMGILVLSAWVLFVAFVFRRALDAFSRDRDIPFLMFGINFLALFLVPLQFDTSISNPSILTAIALTAAMIVHRSRNLGVGG